MADIQSKLTEYVSDAHAMEMNVLRQLDSMISATKDPQMRADLEHHKEETQRHIERLERRLEAHGTSSSAFKDAGAQAAAFFKGMTDMIRSDRPGKLARDGYVTEHLEIASYELLERMAERAGDAETAAAARDNRADEQAMAQKIAASWDKAVDLTLAEEGIELEPRFTREDATTPAGGAGGPTGTAP